MATPPHHASGEGHDQQHVWKVSNTIDQLDMMCEQHHLQTKHVNGLPDWTTPSVPAGVKTPEHRDAPPNFAWAEKKAIGEGREAKHALATQDVPAEETLYAQQVEDELEKQSEALRASTKNMLSRLSLSSTDSLNVAGGESTHEIVRPIDTYPTHKYDHRRPHDNAEAATPASMEARKSPAEHQAL